ncbi:hypothetical protein AQUCO_00300449v1 [Aquilegia coerulea]|uniref:DUF724 domain-containing protein n=1 Tax=Aquilegia coerulea TaxID=218851 RepID=A0A2G5EYY5_AQUCA|nr:hypothetical protein AQUCO_00300449v1 [Aquilegia coerulea]
MSETMDIDSTSTETDSSCDPVYSDQEKIDLSKSENDSEVSQPSKKGSKGQETETPMSINVCHARTPIGTLTDLESQQCVLSFPTQKRKRSKSQSRRAKNRSVSEIIGFPKPHVQCQKNQRVVLPTQQMKEPSGIELERIGVVSNQNQNVVKRKRGRPKGKKCSYRDSDSEAVGSPCHPKGPEYDPTSNEMTVVQTESTQLPSNVVEEHQVPSKILETTDSSIMKDNGGTEGEASTNSQMVSPMVEEHQRLSLCVEKSKPVISGGTEIEPANDVLTTVQTNRTQLLSPTMAYQQPLSSCLEKSNPPTLEDTADNQLMLNEATTLIGTSTKSLKCNQSSNKFENPYSLKAKGDERYQSSVDVTANTYSSSIQEDEGQKPLNNESLPFIKSSNLWENVESMDVFKLIPQHPHFRPLEKLNEELREGAAFGNMWIFVSLMERTCEAQLDDPRSKFENKLKALTDLENLGFTVQPIRSRLEAMLRIKDRCIQFTNKSKAPEAELIDENAKFNEILESIALLNMQLQALLREKERKASQVAELQKTTDEYKEKIQGARLDFNTVRAAPWK